MVEVGQFRDGSGKDVSVMPSRKTITTLNRKLPKARLHSHFMAKFEPRQRDKHGLLVGRTHGSRLRNCLVGSDQKTYEGGDETFVTEMPNASFCFDGVLIAA